MADEGSKDLGHVLGLVVHDLRNPTATLGANSSFLEELRLAAEDSDAEEALQDMKLALGELRQGLEQVAWIARWLAGDAAVSPVDGDVVETLSHAAQHTDGLDVRVEPAPGGAPLRAAGGGASLAALLRVLLANAHQHAGHGGVVVLRARRDGAQVVVELEDTGRALAGDLADQAFCTAGQGRLKGRPDGRYGRVAGLLAARTVADAIGASLEADGEDGAAVFRARLRALD